MTRTTTLILCILSLTLALACSSRREVEPTTQVVTTEGSEAPPEEPVEADPSDVHMVGDEITIDQHILFASDSDEILGDSTTILDHLATFLSHHAAEVPQLEVIGHTDAQGGAAHNQDLSQRRAAAVVAALQERGVTMTLTPIGRGDTEHLCEEDTDECHERNRRVVFHVVR